MLSAEAVNAVKAYYLHARGQYLKHNVAPRLLDAYDNFVLYHREPGDFLQAVLRNDLVGAFARADSLNERTMKNHASFVYTVMSQALRGEENMNQWYDSRIEPTPEMLAQLNDQKTLGALHG